MAEGANEAQRAENGGVSADDARVAQLGNLEKLIEKAVYSHSVENVEHNKFTGVHYYEVSVKYDKEIFDLWINVGVAKNDRKNHLYAITNQADETKRKKRPPQEVRSRPEGNAIQNASSNISIPQNTKKSTDSGKKFSENDGSRRSAISKNRRDVEGSVLYQEGMNVERQMTEAEVEALLDEEVATNLIGEVIGKEEFLKRFDGTETSTLKRILRTLSNMKKRFTGKDKYLYRKADDLFKAFTKVMALEKVGWNSNRSGVRYSLAYNEAIDCLDKNDFDHAKNTHLKVLDHTPQIYIDKAKAKDRKIIMAWDVAYLAMNSNGEIPGNYHGLGPQIMKAIPDALEDPLYIVKQNNGRIAAVTEIVIKGNRTVLVSIELEAYKTTIQEGETSAENYNLIVTVLDAQVRYLKNTVFSGEIVYNKNNEDPAHFILRLKSLKKASSTYDLAESSNPIVAEKDKKSTDSSKKVSENAGAKRKALAKTDAEYLRAVESGDMETAQKMVDEAAKAKGYIPVTRYHQTGKMFTRFSNENPDAALNDSDTPNGYFFKDNDHDIGVGADFVKTGHGGNIQMPVYLKHNNLLYFENREAAQKWYSYNVPRYSELLKKYKEHIEKYKRIDKENTAKMFDELNELVAKGEDTADNELAVVDKYDKVIDDWIADHEAYETNLRAQMRQLLNEYFIENDSGYDGIELADDGHRYIDGKREDVHTYIVFKNTQIKSADPVTYDDNGNVIPLSKRFDSSKGDIRHALPKRVQQPSGDEMIEGAVMRGYGDKLGVNSQTSEKTEEKKPVTKPKKTAAQVARENAEKKAAAEMAQVEEKAARAVRRVLRAFENSGQRKTIKVKDVAYATSLLRVVICVRQTSDSAARS